LVEAAFDGRLGPAEQASMDRHLSLCSSCAELLRELTAIRESLQSSHKPVTALEHQRARLAVLRGAAVVAREKRRPIAILAVALVVLPAAVWAAASTVSLLRGADTQEAAPAPAPSASPAAPSSGSTQDSAAPPEAPRTESSAADVVPVVPTTPAPSRSAGPSPDVVQRAPLPPASGRPSQAAASSAAASREFAEGMDAIARGDFGAGAGKLAGFASAYPRDPRAEEASYLEAVALERAGRTAEAKAAARRYLTTYPGGAHSAPARRLAGD
jgi:TolA-binding protein